MPPKQTVKLRPGAVCRVEIHLAIVAVSGCRVHLTYIRAQGATMVNHGFTKRTRDKIMKFTIQTNGLAMDVSAIERALTEMDPAAMIDLDKANSSLRISSCLDDTELMTLMKDAGFPVASSDVRGVPSECCGGCGG